MTPAPTFVWRWPPSVQDSAWLEEAPRHCLFPLEQVCFSTCLARVAPYLTGSWQWFLGLGSHFRLCFGGPSDLEEVSVRGSWTSCRRASSRLEALARHRTPPLSSSHYLIVPPCAHPLPPFCSRFPCLVLTLLDPEAQGQEPWPQEALLKMLQSWSGQDVTIPSHK